MIGKIGKCVCLRDGTNLTPLMPELALVHRFTVHFAVAKKRVFIVTFENKNLIGLEGLVSMEQFEIKFVGKLCNFRRNGPEMFLDFYVNT